MDRTGNSGESPDSADAGDRAEVEALRRRVSQLTALNATIQRLSGQLDLASIHAIFEEHLRGAIGFDLAAVSLLEDDRHFRHLDTGEVVTAPGVIGKAGSATDWVVSHRRSLVRTDILSDKRFRVSDRTRASGIRSDLLMPLVSRERVVGTLSLAGRKPGMYRAEDVELLQPLADQLAISVDNARLYRNLNRAYEEMKEMQLQVLEGEKLRALGEMAAGVAHNFNNLLTSVLGYAQLLQMNPDGALRSQGLEVIEKCAREGAKIAREMQDFARSQSERPMVPTDLNHLVRRSLLSLEGRLKPSAPGGSRVEVRTELSDLPSVPGDETNLGRAITNLLVNAIDAMPEGGTLTVGTRVAEAEDPKEAARVCLRVSDTGVGMNEAERRRIFEPFFTTKGPQVGKGLGLSVAYGVILRHQGRIEVEAEPGRGTSFTVWLPSSPPKDGERAETPSADRESPRVLVIEDDRTTREILVLSLKGYRVEAVEDGQKGLEAFEKNRHEIVVTDLGMPGLNGWDVAKAVKRISGETRVIMITGWNVAVSRSELEQSGVEEILHKPFTLEQIHAVLGRQSHSTPIPDAGVGI